MKSSSVLLHVKKSACACAERDKYSVRKTKNPTGGFWKVCWHWFLTLISQTLYFYFKKIILEKIVHLHLKCCIQFEKTPFLILWNFRKVSILVIIFFFSMTLFPSIIIFVQNTIFENFDENLKTAAIFTVKMHIYIFFFTIF